MNTYKVAVLIDCIPSYRKDFYARLIDFYGKNIKIYCQALMPGHESMKLSHENFTDNVNIVSYLAFYKDKLVIQFLPYLELLKNYDTYVIYGNPRFPSTLLFAFLLKFLRKKVIIWAQFHTANANPNTEKIRHWILRRFDNFFLYNDTEVSHLKAMKSNALCVYGMNNGLDQEEIDNVVLNMNDSYIREFKKNNQLTDKRVVLSCARLLKKNNFDFFIHLLPDIIKLYPDIVWCVIGVGDEKDRLQELANNLSVSRYIMWLGEIYKQEELAPWYLSSTVLVHPSGAGLSLNHAFGYGLPVITHSDYYSHMPEIYAVKDGYNGVLYERDNAVSFIANIRRILDDSRLQKTMSKNALKTVREKYNTKVMSQRFMEMIECVNKRACK